MGAGEVKIKKIIGGSLSLPQFGDHFLSKMLILLGTSHSNAMVGIPLEVRVCFLRVPCSLYT